MAPAVVVEFPLPSPCKPWKGAFANRSQRSQTVRLPSDLGKHHSTLFSVRKPFAESHPREKPSEYATNTSVEGTRALLHIPWCRPGSLVAAHAFWVWAGFSANVWSRSPTTKNVFAAGIGQAMLALLLQRQGLSFFVSVGSGPGFVFRAFLYLCPISLRTVEIRIF